MMGSYRWGVVGAVLLAVTLSGCGGGGGGGGAPPVREALPTQVLDIDPTGARLDHRDRNYFPAGTGDTWTYDLVEGGATTPDAVVRTVVSSDSTSSLIRETHGATSATVELRRTAAGIVEVDPLRDIAPPSARALVGDLLEFPEPFYPVGTTRTMVRQGSWGEDLDGDGHAESFRLEINQVLVGFETLSLPRGSAETVRFRTTVVLTMSPSNPQIAVVSATSVEESWWAPGIGMVRAEMDASTSDGSVSVPRQTLAIASGTVGGVELFAAPPDGTLVKLSLLHNALVFDALRNVYYASVPGSVPGAGNSIATVDAATGAVVHSAAVGSEPSALAISGDGSALYVGLNGSGEVAKLQLPAMTESYRTRLPVSPFYGQLLAESLAASPIDPDVVAVALLRPNVSPRHGGVALLRAGAVQPTVTQEHTGSNQIVFDPNGQFVYGFNNESTEFGLRRLAVRIDGLVEEAVVSTNSDFSIRTELSWSARGLVLGKAIYRGSDLALLGQVNAAGGGCRPLAVNNRFACFDDFGSGPPSRLAVVDASTLVVLATPAYAVTSVVSPPTGLVAGPAGQVALRVGNSYRNQPATEVWLFTSPSLG